MGIIPAMPFWAVAGIVYFGYVLVVAVARRTVPRRAQAISTGVLGLTACALSAYITAYWLRLIVLPPLALLIAYWSSGFLWVAPMEHVEAWFVRSDHRLGIVRIAARLPHGVTVLLELAYAAIYPLIPLALVLHLAFVPGADAGRFWTVIVVTDFICFGMLPWIQTRPPRALEARPPWFSPVRAFNLQMLRQASIGVNTVPSGHAAEAVAAALLVSGAPWPAQAAMWLAAIAVSAGAVFGRYHFALDALAGWAVALLVWSAIPGG